MRRDGPVSGNVVDRRGMGRGGLIGGGIGTVVLVVVGLMFGVDPRVILGMAETAQTVQQSRAPQGPAKAPTDEAGRFVQFVLGDTEQTWNALFKQLGRDYQEPKVILFTGATPTACGTGQAAMGPFYCPLDASVYFDLDFFKALQQKLNAAGDTAQAYVIAHEVGHHVQNQLGIMEKVQSLKQRVGGAQANQLSVRLELQADCLAGVWGKHTETMKNVLEPGDLEAALNAASAIGDDRLQQQMQGRIVPESFTHGTSAQRMRWFKRGFESGDMNRCNTFKATQL